MSAPTATSPGISTLLPGQTPEGDPTLAVLLKRTYQIIPSGKCVRAETDHQLLGGDKHYGDPMNSTVRFESDFVPYKLATDVVFDGCAYSPPGRPQRELLASLEVGRTRKVVKVIGDRVSRYRPAADPVFSDPAPFQKMELRYERAYGGVDVYTNSICQYVYPRNHLGKGFAIGNSKQAVDGLELPNIEDPSDLLTPARLCVGKMDDWPRQPSPAGFGWYSNFWQPRVGWAGILPGDKPTEEMLRAAYAKLLEPPFRAIYEANPLPVVDFRFFNGASPGLSFPYLRGDETLRLTNLTPNGNFSFQLPDDRPLLTLDLGDGPQEQPVALHTVQIRSDEGMVDLVWRTAFPYPGLDWLPEMQRCEIGIHG